MLILKNGDDTRKLEMHAVCWLYLYHSVWKTLQKSHQVIFDDFQTLCIYLTLQLLFLWYTAVVSKSKVTKAPFFMAKITKSCSCSREPNSKSFLDTSSYRAQADDPSKVCLTLTASIVWNKSKNVELFSAKNWIPCPKRNFEFSRQIIVNQK